MPLCFLHVGLHKSASTSLQRTLLANHERLAAHGIHVPATRSNDHRRPHELLAWEFLKRKRRVVTPGGFAELKEELDWLGRPERILLSSEDFENALHRPADVERLIATFAGLGYRLRLIAYVRPQVPYINSSYAQTTKMMANTLDVADFVAEALERMRYDYEKLILPVTRMEGIETDFRPFSRAILEAGIARDFFSALGLGDEAIADLTMLAPFNESPGPKTVAACLAIARRHAAAGVTLDLAHRRRASRLVRELGTALGWDARKFSGLTPEQAETIAQRFARSNDAFARGLWGKSWDEVYGEDSQRPKPLDVFDPAAASEEERAEFEEAVETAWQLLQRGGGRRADDHEVVDAD
jgi:hypothetical protein